MKRPPEWPKNRNGMTARGHKCGNLGVVALAIPKAVGNLLIYVAAIVVSTITTPEMMNGQGSLAGLQSCASFGAGVSKVILGRSTSG